MKLGMSTPRDEWEMRRGQVEATGGRLLARRLFVQSFSQVPSFLTIARSEAAAGRLPVLSLSVDDWAGVAAGRYDPQIRVMVAQCLDAGVPMSWTFKHEPIGDGAARDYAAMQLHVAPMFGAAGLSYGPIFNGFAWSQRSQGMTDAEIAAWLPDQLLPLCAFVASDTYQGGTTASPGESAGPKIAGMSAWATRKGVRQLGLGEFNGLTAAALEDAYASLHADPRYLFACLFNSSANNRPGVDWTLSGDRLYGFQRQLVAQTPTGFLADRGEHGLVGPFDTADDAAAWTDRAGHSHPARPLFAPHRRLKGRPDA